MSSCGKARVRTCMGHEFVKQLNCRIEKPKSNARQAAEARLLYVSYSCQQ